jgi:hypothetical protein
MVVDVDVNVNVNGSRHAKVLSRRAMIYGLGVRLISVSSLSPWLKERHDPGSTDLHGATLPQPNYNRSGVQPLGCATHRRLKPALQTSAWRFLGVLRDLAVKLCVSIHRQDAKNAKKSAKRKFFAGGQEFSS